MPIYLDNAATTQTCPEAARAALEVMTEGYGNPSSGHAAGRAALERLKADLNAGKNLDFAVGHCFRHSYTTLFDGRMALVILLILVLAAVDLAAEGLGWLAPVQAFTNLFRIKEAAVSLHAFFFAVLSGVVANYLMCGRIARSMLRSLSKYPLLRDPVFYGGTRHA